MTVSVSVVVPTHCSESTIERALQSVVAQTTRPCEIIVVDDASTDGTWSLIERLSSEMPIPVRSIALPQNLGPGSARNAGWDVASGEWVAFLDADDEWHPLKLSLQHALMVDDPTLAMSGHLHAFGIDNDWATIPDQPTIARFGLGDFLVRNRCSTPSVMVRRSIEQRFERGSSYAEDYLLWMRIVVAHGPCARIEERLVRCANPAFGGSGLSGQMVDMERAELHNFRVLRRDGAIGPVTMAVASWWSMTKFLVRLARSEMRRFWRS